MSDTILLLANIALLVQVILLPLVFYFLVVRGNTSADKLVGVDTITTLLIGIVVVLAVIENTSTTVDIGISLAALSFAGTLSFARYISEGRVF